MLVAGVGVLAWVYQSVQPPQPKMVTAVTSPKIKLRDGRHLAYKELGVHREEAKFKMKVLQVSWSGADSACS